MRLSFVGSQPESGYRAGYGMRGSVAMNSSSRMQLVVFLPTRSGPTAAGRPSATHLS
jgi:hypothetical protein